MKKLLSINLFIAFVIVGCINKTNHTDQHVRHIELEGEPNFRDIGGYNTVDGKTVKWGQIYRSGKLSNLTETDVMILDSLNINTVVNFLTPQEIEHAGMDIVSENVEVLLSPIDVGGDWSLVILAARKAGDFSMVDKSLNPEFHRMLVEEAKEQYAILIREILDSEKRPLVFHCSHGIHRTGTAVSILLWSLGVPWETVREDYLLSNKYRKTQIDKRVAQLIQMGKDNPGVADKKENAENIEAFYILQGYYIDAVKETIEKEYGSIDKYMTDGLGLSESEIKSLKSQLLK